MFLLSVMYQKRLKKERRARKRLQEQLELEIKRRTQLEEALKATGASSEQVRAITGKYQFRVKMEREKRRVRARLLKDYRDTRERKKEREEHEDVVETGEFPSSSVNCFPDDFSRRAFGLPVISE